MTAMTAKYKSSCVVCGNLIRPGQQIDYSKESGARHLGCTPYEPPEDAIYLAKGEGYGGRAFHAGQVLRNGYRTMPVPFGADDPRHAWMEPEYLYVLHARQDYVREDGMSFGVGDESGYIYSAYCRAATDAEAAPLRSAEERKARIGRIRARVKEIVRQIERREHLVETRATMPQGTRYFDTYSIYGAGHALLVEDNPADPAVWYLENNGMDGDNWGASNLPHLQIGFRLPDPDGTLGREIAALDARLTELASEDK